MAKSSALTSALAAALLAGSVGLAHAQGGGGGGGAGGGAGAAGSASGATGQTGGTAGTAGTIGTNPAVGGTNPNSAANQPGTNLNNSGVGRASAAEANTAVGGGGHRQPRKGDLPRNGRQGNMPDKKQKDIDSRIGSICRGC